MDIGNRIIYLRKSKDISQEDLAALAGVSRQTVSKWETNTVQPSAENIKVLSKIFSVPADYFFTDAPLTELTAAYLAAAQAVDKKAIKKVNKKSIGKTKKKTKKPECKKVNQTEKPVRTNGLERSLVKYAVIIAAFVAVLAVMIFLTVRSGLEMWSEAVFVFLLVATSFVFATVATLLVMIALKIKYGNVKDNSANKN